MEDKNRKNLTKSASAFQLTINQIEIFDDIREYLLSLKQFKYGIACKETAPSTGHKHIHIYVQFNRSVRLSLEKLKGAHIEKCFGSPQQNVAYIKKDGNIIWENGEMKQKGGKTIAQVKQMTKEEREQLPAAYYNIVNKINEEENNQLKLEDFEKKVEVVFIYGESGIGKTQKAKQIIKEYMERNNVNTFNLIKYENSFWMGVSEISEIALYDDFRDSHMKPSEFINLIDYNVHPMNIKGGSIKNKYKFIIITSVQNPDNLWKNVQEKDEEPKKQWLRRMKIIYMDEPFK